MSKESKGVVVGKLEEVAPTGPQRIGLVAFFVALPLALYAMTFVFDYIYQAKSATSTAAGTNSPNAEKQVEELHGWTTPTFYKRTSASVYRDFVDQKIVASVQALSRKKDSVSVPVLFENRTSVPIIFTLSINAAGSQEQVPIEERRKSGIFVLPGTRSEARVTATVQKPAQGSESLPVYVECFIENGLGDTLKLTRLVKTN